MAEIPAEEFASLNAEAQEIWNRNAGWWDERVGGEGNRFHQTLIAPATMQLLALQPGERVLDIACGNGQFARQMAAGGAKVTAVDFSEVFIERAKARTGATGQIAYRVIDAADFDQLLTLGAYGFNAAVCNMGLMDMATIKPLLAALRRLLNTGGRFVFSVSHPCFNSTGSKMVAEREDRAGEMTITRAISVSAYRRPTAKKGVGIVGQPAPHYYFHRSISDLLNACFEAGFAVDGFEEPVFEQTPADARLFSWSNFTDIPPLIVVRARLITPA